MNLKVRLKNIHFWIPIISGFFVLVRATMELLGLNWPVDEVQEITINLLYWVFSVLALIGIVNDPTTQGLYDSERALSYDRPN